MKKIVAAACASLILASGAAWATPSAQQVEAAVRQGHWQQADAELVAALQAHPDSARAHYLYGQVLDREGRYTEALAQIEQARTLDPQVHFTDPSRFARTEAYIQRAAQRAGANAEHPANPLAAQRTSLTTGEPTLVSPTPPRHGPSIGPWIGIASAFALLLLARRWVRRRARSKDEARAGGERQTQLKRATELLNALRASKLDAKLSAAPGHDVLEREIDGVEFQLRELAETLSNGDQAVAPYRLDELERQVASLRARAEGRPDPYPAASAGAAGSAYAPDAGARFAAQSHMPYPAAPQQAPVIVQQGGGLFGGALGGILTGALLGEAFGFGRDRVIERDVWVDETGRRDDNGGGLDYGEGANDWSPGGDDSFDMVGNDDAGGWVDS
ncbi:MAG: tetratricopeptide repeat protein [Pararobbsia sp.]